MLEKVAINLRATVPWATRRPDRRPEVDGYLLIDKRIQTPMLDHLFLTVSDLARSIAFYEKALAPLGVEHVLDYDGKDGPEGHPDLKGFGRDSRISFWLRQGKPHPGAVHVGFLAHSEDEVRVFHQAAMAAGAQDNGAPSPRDYYDPRYYAANVLDPDGYSLEAVYKSWQHPQP